MLKFLFSLMPNLFCFLVTGTLAISMMVPALGQETQSLGDIARRVRSEKQVSNEPMAGRAQSRQK
jgi:hypothetical protein